MAGKLDFPNFLILCRSLSDQLCSVFHYVRLIVFVLCRMRLSFIAVMHFMLPESVYVVLNILSFLLCFLRFFIFLLLVFHIFLEPNRHFPLKWIPVFSVALLAPFNHK